MDLKQTLQMSEQQHRQKDLQVTDNNSDDVMSVLTLPAKTFYFPDHSAPAATHTAVILLHFLRVLQT